MKQLIKKAIGIAKEINNAGNYKIIEELPDETYKKCPECEGTGFFELFFNIECEHCKGTSIVKKSYKELHFPNDEL